MKVKNNILKNFVKETCLNGEHSLTEVSLDFNDNGLFLQAVVPGNTILVKGQLRKEAFSDYVAYGKIAVLNYTELLKILGALKEEVEMKVEGSMIVFKGGRTIEVPLADTSIVEENKVPNFEYDNSFVINKSVFDEVEANSSFSNNKSDALNINFVGSNNVLKIKYGSKYKFEDVVTVEGIKEDFSVKFGEPFINAVHNLTGELMVQMKSDFPLTINKKNDDYAIKIIVAPKVDN